MAGFKILSLAVALGVIAASAAVAEPKAYVYTPPAPEAVTSALQNRATGFDTTAPNPTLADAAVTPIDNRPGLIRPASELATAQHRDDDHRGFACVDDKCKIRTPVYNSETPIQREQGLLGRN